MVGAAACAADAILRPVNRLAATLLGLALACEAATEFGARIDITSGLLALAGTIALVERRFGLMRLSLLDAALGGTAKFALALTAGLSASASAAACAIAVVLSLSRWRISPAVALGLVG